MEYKVIYSKRKTLAITVRNGEVLVRAPIGLKQKRIEQFLAESSDWIGKQLEKSHAIELEEKRLTPEFVRKLKSEARKYFHDAIERFSRIMNLKYGRVMITSAKRRFGSCSESGNICFSYRLMMYPEAAREYVVVHELAHLVEMNHSKRFYAIVERYMPDYKERKKLLKSPEN